MTDNPQCPSCGGALERVRQDENSPLSADQFDAVRAGDWFCARCPSNGRGRLPHAYFWEREVVRLPCEGEGPGGEPRTAVKLCEGICVRCVRPCLRPVDAKDNMVEIPISISCPRCGAAGDVVDNLGDGEHSICARCGLCWPPLGHKQETWPCPVCMQASESSDLICAAVHRANSRIATAKPGDTADKTLDDVMHILEDVIAQTADAVAERASAVTMRPWGYGWSSDGESWTWSTGGAWTMGQAMDAARKELDDPSRTFWVAGFERGWPVVDPPVYSDDLVETANDAWGDLFPESFVTDGERIVDPEPDQLADLHRRLARTWAQWLVESRVPVNVFRIVGEPVKVEPS